MSNSNGTRATASRVTPARPESPSELLPRDRALIWGLYLSDRQWGTVREDYSEGGPAWEFFSHDRGLLCFVLSFWNGVDPILKERLFGLTDDEGNYGEDVKEAYCYLDGTPDHSYMGAFYERFHGDTGAGLGASHETGWTALVARLVEDARRDVASRSISGRSDSAAPTRQGS